MNSWDQMIVFTICSKNFLAYAQVLHDSLVENHKNIHFYVALCDDIKDFDTRQFNFNIIDIFQLGIPSLKDMIDRYNITELNTAIKPFVFQYLFDEYPGKPIIYLDPDILVLSPLVELIQSFDDGADCVLTPHITEPAEFAEMHDGKFLNFGIFNLGFCALRGTPEVQRVVSWWGRRLEKDCVIDLTNGLFVDQKWADLLPAFIEKTKILRHPGYNAAYWNLSQRRIVLSGSEWKVNGQPLRFFHFSGNHIEDEDVFCRHSSQFTTHNIGDVRHLLYLYRSRIYARGHQYYKQIQYGFSWNGASGKNEHTPISVQEARANQEVQNPYLPMLRCHSLSEFLGKRADMAEVIGRRHAIEISCIPVDEDAYVLPGWCSCCGKEALFQVSGMYSSRKLEDGRVFPNWREHLNCLSCGIVNRIRAAFQILRQEFSPDADAAIYITERITKNFDWLKSAFPNTQGSEYFLGNYRSGDLVGDVQHQDVQALSYGDSIFDFILTFDVLEHVPDHSAALREFFRCLKPNGVLIITVPFHAHIYDYTIRARLLANGEIEHIMEPEYHGNPVDMEQGSLCWKYFGWRLLDELLEIGFVDAQVLNYWSERLRHFGDPQLVITARKAVPRT